MRGTLGPDGLLRASGTGQAFALAGPRLAELRQAAQGASLLTVYGRWRAAPSGATAETIEAERWGIAQ